MKQREAFPLPPMKADQIRMGLDDPTIEVTVGLTRITLTGEHRARLLAAVGAALDEMFREQYADAEELARQEAMGDHPGADR